MKISRNEGTEVGSVCDDGRKRTITRLNTVGKEDFMSFEVEKDL